MKTRVDRPTERIDGPRQLGFSERVALFVCAMHKDHADELLAGFADKQRARAEEFAKQVRRWDSSTRQARLSREFGTRLDAAERLKQLIVEASPELRAAIAAQLPPAQRAAYPHLCDAQATPSPAMVALAARLVRYATR